MKVTVSHHRNVNLRRSVFSRLVNDSTTTAVFVKSYYQQTADIDLTDVQWKSIGTQATPFNGHYNGNYCVVTGLNISAMMVIPFLLRSFLTGLMYGLFMAM